MEPEPETCLESPSVDPLALTGQNQDSPSLLPAATPPPFLGVQQGPSAEIEDPSPILSSLLPGADADLHAETHTGADMSPHLRSSISISEAGTMMALQMSQSQTPEPASPEQQTGREAEQLSHQQSLHWDSLLSNHVTNPRLPPHQQAALAQQQPSQLAMDSFPLYQQPQQNHSLSWDRLAYAATGGLLTGGAAASALQSSLPPALGLPAGAVTPTMAALLASGGRWMDAGHGHSLFTASGELKQGGIRKKGFRTEPVPQSGFKGVSWNSRMKAWLAFYVTENGERKSKTFSTRKLGMEEARLQAIAFCKAKQDQRREARKRNRDIVASSSFYTQTVAHPSLSNDSRGAAQAPQMYSNAIHAAVYGGGGLSQHMTSSGLQGLNGTHVLKESDSNEGGLIKAEDGEGRPFSSAAVLHQHSSPAAAATAAQTGANGAQYYPSIFTHFMFSPQQSGTGSPHGNGSPHIGAGASTTPNEGTSDPRLSPDALLYFSQFLSPPLQQSSGLPLVSDMANKLAPAAPEKEALPVAVDDRKLPEE